MATYIFKRLLLMIPTLFLILLTNFAIVQAAPGGPVEQAMEMAKHGLNGQSSSGGEAAASSSVNTRYQGSSGLSNEMLAKIKAQYGFDKSPLERFWIMLKGYATLDFGTSFFKDKPVTTLLKEKLPVSLSLGLWSTILIYAIAIPLGIKKAKGHGQFFDKATGVFLVAGYAIPSFLFAVLLLVLFAGGSFWQIFPLQHLTSDDFADLTLWGKIKDYAWHLVLPTLAIIVGGFAGLTYLTKFSFMEEIGKQYVLSARAKGLNEKQVMYGHVFRNAMLVVIAGLPVTLVGIFFTGNLLLEIVFNLDGVGLLGFDAIQHRDYPIIFGTLFIYTVLGMVLTLISDVLYRVIDPRIDFGQRENV